MKIRNQCKSCGVIVELDLEDIITEDYKEEQTTASITQENVLKKSFICPICGDRTTLFTSYLKTNDY